MNVRRTELEKSWARTRSYLDNAFVQLPTSPTEGEEGEEGGSMQKYREWLDYNELELALDELEMLGEANGLGTSFWESLLRAAAEMELDDHTVRLQRRLAGYKPMR